MKAGAQPTPWRQRKGPSWWWWGGWRERTILEVVGEDGGNWRRQYLRTQTDILKMLLFVVVLILTLQPALSQRCVTAVNTVNPDYIQHYTFLKQHLNNKVPKSLNIREWETFITKIKTWDRPVQSFFLYSESEFDKVLDVCSTEGKIYPNTKNLCISKKTFNFFTVTVNTKMKVKKVEFIKNRHVILGCEKEKILNKCLPIHFEANINDAKPDNNQPDCSG
ncbi:hypothetical protein PO909_028498 [Leuciscus waleckii]